MTGTLSTSLSKHHWVIILNSHVTAGLQMKKRLSFEMEEQSSPEMTRPRYSSSTGAKSLRIVKKCIAGRSGTLAFR